MEKQYTLSWMIVTLLIVFGFSACDKIEGPYGESATIVTNNRKVLLEDFTGHTCQNCPDAHREAQRLHDIYGDRLVILGIHWGFYARPQNAPYTADFRNATDSTLATKFGITLYPSGVVNRLYNSVTNRQYVLSWSEWETSVDSVLSRPADATLKLSNYFNASDSMMTTTVRTSIVNDYANPVGLAVYFTEDSIISPQKVGSIDSLNYVHRHMLRGAFNGAFGEIISSDVVGGDDYTNTYSAKLIPSTANVSQVYIVALLFDNITKQIIQVEEKKLVQ